MSAGDRPDSPPRECATCGDTIQSWFSTSELWPQVFCSVHHRFGGMWAGSLNGEVTVADESVQGPDTAPEGANGSMDAPSDGGEA